LQSIFFHPVRRPLIVALLDIATLCFTQSQSDHRGRNCIPDWSTHSLSEDRLRRQPLLRASATRWRFSKAQAYVTRAAPRDLPAKPNNDFADEVHSYFDTGTQLQKMYIKPSLLKPAYWDSLAERHDEAGRRALKDVHVLAAIPINCESTDG
jgi:hypothetical protein